MANTSLPVSNLIAVNVNLAPQAAQSQSLSSLLIVGSSDLSPVDLAQLYNNYASIEEVGSDFYQTDPEYLAASLWFSQTPQPTSVSIGVWAASTQPGVLVGSRVSDKISPTTTGAFTLPVNGTYKQITSVSISLTDTNITVAATLTTKLGRTVKYDTLGSRFKFYASSTTAPGYQNMDFMTPPSVFFEFTGNPASGDTITLHDSSASVAFTYLVTNGIPFSGTAAEVADRTLDVLQASTEGVAKKFSFVRSTQNLFNTNDGTLTSSYPIILCYRNNPASTEDLNITKISTGISLSNPAIITGSDYSCLLGGSVNSLASPTSMAYLVPFQPAETPIDAIHLLDNNFGQQWYAVQILGATDNQLVEVSQYLESTNARHIHAITTQSVNSLDTVDSTSLLTRLKNLSLNRSFTQYSSTNAYAVASAMAKMLSTDYTANNSVMTLMYKQEPSVVAERLTSSQLTTLESKNGNAFVAYNNNTNIIRPGKVASGEFLDTIVGVDWLALTIQTAVYNLLYLSPTKIPQTDAGTHLITTIIEGVCYQALNNGLLAPGTWQSDGIGALSYGDFMPKGFYVYAPLVSTQSVADRSARKSVPIQVAVKLSGAIHSVVINVSVNH